MSNKINGFENRPVKVGSERPVERGSQSRSSGTPAPVTGEVQITDSAMRLAALERALADVPEVDEQRVAKLRASIESGDYSIDARRIASRLVELEQALHTALNRKD